MTDVVDQQGYRANVGIVLINNQKEIFFAKRKNQSGWQFPQGGIRTGESLKSAMYRELLEETGLTKDHVEVIYQSKTWYQYKIPKTLLRKPRFKRNSDSIVLYMPPTITSNTNAVYKSTELGGMAMESAQRVMDTVSKVDMAEGFGGTIGAIWDALPGFIDQGIAEVEKELKIDNKVKLKGK